MAVQADQVHTALGEEAGVVGQIRGALVVLHIGRESPESDRVSRRRVRSPTYRA